MSICEYECMCQCWCEYVCEHECVYVSVSKGECGCESVGVSVDVCV